MRTSPLLLIFDLAGLEARSASSTTIDTPHLVLGLAKACDLKFEALWPHLAAEPLPQALKVQTDELAQAFARAGVDPQKFRRRLRYQIHARGAEGTSDELRADDGVLHRTRAAKRAFERAAQLHTQSPDASETSPRLVHLLRALAERPDAFWHTVWQEFSAQPPLAALFGDEMPPAEASPAKAPRFAGAPTATPTLDRFGRDLSALARAGKLESVWGRDAEIVRLAQILASARKGNALLIGEAGVGKTAVVEGLANRLTASQLPPGLENLRLIEVPLAGLLAGASYRGEWEERLQKLLKEAEIPGIVLFFDEIHTLVGAGGQGASDAAQIVKPALARGAVRAIGATTPAEYARTIERDPALSRRFEAMWIEEPSRALTLDILRRARPRLEAHHAVAFEDAALEAAIELSVRLLPDLRLPDKALDALDSAASAVRLHTLSYSPSAAPPPVVGREAVAEALAKRARVPLEQVRAFDASRLRGLEARLKNRVVGQDPAIRRVADALKLAFSGFKPTHQPRGVFLFVGASGSGKTELAKALAEALYGDERALLRFDMSEYSESHTVARLLGAPPGYVGHEQEGQLSAKLRARPASVLLFDEIEKAHPDVWNVFLPLFDEGHLTDARGRRLDFAETVIVLTSNLGTGAARPRALGFRAHEADRDERAPFEAEVLGAVREAMRPELLGRIGEVLVFPPLDAAARGHITAMLLAEIAARAGERGVRLEWSPAVVEWLAAQGFDAQTGVRPLRRAVERRVALPLAEALLEGSFGAGDTARLEMSGDELALVKPPPTT